MERTQRPGRRQHGQPERTPWRRASVRAARSTRRYGRQRGQTMIIFALSITVLVALAGLAIDVVRAYDLYAREQRAAEAGALAGVLYMSKFYNTPASSDNQCAISSALLQVNNDGFGPGALTCGSLPKGMNTNCTGEVADFNTGVTVCHYVGSKTGLQVTVSQNIQIFLLSVVGFSQVPVTATAAADYLPPFLLGSKDPAGDGGYFGDGGQCSAQPQNCKTKNPPNHFAAAISGPAELKEQGDPFVYCEEGNSANSIIDNAATSSGPLSSFPYGFPTNHQDTGSLKCGANQPDTQYSGYGPRNTPFSHAYSYAIVTDKPVSVWIWNPNYIPTVTSGASCTGLTQVDGFYNWGKKCTGYANYGVVGLTPSLTTFSDPRLYFSMDYGLYNVQSLYDRSQDLSMTSTGSFHPADGNPSDLKALGCNSANQVWQVATSLTSFDGQCISAATGGQYAWDGVGTITSGDITSSAIANNGQAVFRLAAEATPWDNDATCTNTLLNPDGVCGWGMHSYGIKICDVGTAPSQVQNCTLSANAFIQPWENMDIYLTFQANNGNNVIPLADVPSDYAGHTVSVSVFDPGDSFGNPTDLQFAIVPASVDDNGAANPPYADPAFSTNVAGQSPPRNISQKCPAAVPAQYCPPSGRAWWVNASNNDDQVYNGVWVTVTFQLPPGYKGGEWWFTALSSGSSFDQLAVEFQGNGSSPVHLVL
ncbi:MAG TPA: pilus assembly protein TadG-related protein [Ktedonobacterales bacterium]|jgi:Flp pilus assembly protein TadG